MSIDHKLRRVLAPFACAALALGTQTACESRTGDKPAVMDDASAGRVDGVWQVTLRIERPMSLSTEEKSLPRDVAGTIALVPLRNAALSFETMTDPTFSGVYDLDPRALGLSTGVGGSVPGLVARIAARTGQASGGAPADSIWVVLNPEAPAHAIRLAGVISEGAVRGVWVAESPMGGGGTFVWRRRHARDPGQP